MRLRGNGLTLTGAEGKSPPLPFITVDDGEGEALLSLYPKSIIRVDDVADEPRAPGGDDGDGEGLHANEATIIEQAHPNSGQPADEGHGGLGDQSGEGGDGQVDEVASAAEAADQSVADKRFNEIADAIDLLDTASFVATGPRKGRPKVKAVEEIIGYDVTMEEVDQVFLSTRAD